MCRKLDKIILIFFAHFWLLHTAEKIIHDLIGYTQGGTSKNKYFTFPFRISIQLILKLLHLLPQSLIFGYILDMHFRFYKIVFSLCCLFFTQSRVTDMGVNYITEGPFAVELRELDLSYCPKVTDLSLKRITQR